MVRPPFPYYGGKQTLAHRIVALLPAHRHYVEPFAGSLAVLLAKPPSPMETVNDLDQRLMTFWRVLRDRPQDLIRVCALTPHSRAEYQAAHEPAEDELEIARRIWVVLTQGRAAPLRGTTGWRHYLSVESMATRLESYVDRLDSVATRLRSVSLECRPALEVVESYGAHENSLLYVDPPYLGATRASRGYRHEMPADDDHRALCEALHGVNAAVVLSGYPSALYDRLYADWERVTIASGTSQGGNRKEPRTEVLWSNRPLAAQLSMFEDAAS